MVYCYRSCTSLFVHLLVRKNQLFIVLLESVCPGVLYISHCTAAQKEFFHTVNILELLQWAITCTAFFGFFRLGSCYQNLPHPSTLRQDLPGAMWLWPHRPTDGADSPQEIEV